MAEWRGGHQINPLSALDWNTHSELDCKARVKSCKASRRNRNSIIPSRDIGEIQEVFNLRDHPFAVQCIRKALNALTINQSISVLQVQFIAFIGMPCLEMCN